MRHLSASDGLEMVKCSVVRLAVNRPGFTDDSWFAGGSIRCCRVFHTQSVVPSRSEKKSTGGASGTLGSRSSNDARMGVKSRWECAPPRSATVGLANVRAAGVLFNERALVALGLLGGLLFFLLLFGQLAFGV